MLNLLRERRSVRKYKDKEIEEEKIKKLKEAAVRSPSSRSRNPWRFIFVNDADLLEKLSRAKQHGSKFLKDAPLGVVVCGDKNKSDAWVEDCSIASIILQFTAQDLDLGSCWIQIRNRNHNDKTTSSKFVKEKMDVPDNFEIESIISIGYPDQEKKGIPKDNLDFDKIYNNRYND